MDKKNFEIIAQSTDRLLALFIVLCCVFPRALCG